MSYVSLKDSIVNFVEFLLSRENMAADCHRSIASKSEVQDQETFVAVLESTELLTPFLRP